MPADAYGGQSELGVFEKTGFFRIVNRNGRYLFVTPEGNGMWLRACYGVDITDGGQTFVDALHAKYKTDSTYSLWGYWWPFVANAVRLLRENGFNAIGEYSSNYALPVESHSRGRGNSEKMAFLSMVNAANYSKSRYGVKNLMYGVDPEVTPDLWRVEGFPDVFDPAFAKAADAMIGSGDSPWLVGVSTDDRDYLFGFGPTREFGGWHNHLGWQAAVTRPTQDGNPHIWVGSKAGVTYTDTTVYTKLAFRDFLRNKYRTLDQLNAAWGSTYTTWDRDGKPWPNGKGVLDESGRNAWIGKDFYLASDARPQVKADLDAFVGVITDKYFSVTAGTLKAKSPHYLVFSPAAISPGAHPEVLKAAGRWCDAVQFGCDAVKFGADYEAAFQRGYGFVKKPFFVWTTFMSQADSPLAGKKGWEGFDYPTQEARGLAYADFIKRLVVFRANDGHYPCVGIDWWAYCDKVTGGEGSNFGLVTNRDNPYDGKAARVSRGTDRWGNPTGGEARDYGDFLSAVKAANRAIPDYVRALDRRAGQGGRRTGDLAGSLLTAAVLLGAVAQGSEVQPSRRELLKMMGAVGASGLPLRKSMKGNRKGKDGGNEP